MKHKSIRFLLVALLLCVLAGCGGTEAADTFDLTEYQYFLSHFPSNRTVAEIHNADQAAAQAEHLWIDIYGEDVLEKKPYQVFYDKNNDVWLIRGTLPEMMFGGVPWALIQSDGTVLAVWHDK